MEEGPKKPDEIDKLLSTLWNAKDTTEQRFAEDSIREYSKLFFYGLHDLLRIGVEEGPGRDHARDAAEYVLRGEIDRAVVATLPMFSSVDYNVVNQASHSVASLAGKLNLTDGTKVLITKAVAPLLDGENRDLGDDFEAYRLAAAVRRDGLRVLESLRFPPSRAVIEPLLSSRNRDIRSEAANTMLKAGLLTDQESATLGAVLTDFVTTHYSLRQVFEAAVHDIRESAKSMISTSTLRRAASNVSDPAEPGAAKAATGLSDYVNDLPSLVRLTSVLGRDAPVLAIMAREVIALGDAEFLAAIDDGQTLSPQWEETLDRLIDKVAETPHLGTLTPPPLYAAKSMKTVLHRHGVAEDSLVGSITTSGPHWMNGMSKTLGHLPTKYSRRALEHIRTQAWEPQIADSAERGIRSSAHRNAEARGGYVDIQPGTWDYLTRTALLSEAERFLSKPANRRAVEQVLGIADLQFSDLPERDYQVPTPAKLVLEALQQDDGIRSRFATASGRASGHRARDVVRLADPEQAPGMDQVLAPIRELVTARVRQSGSLDMQF